MGGVGREGFAGSHNTKSRVDNNRQGHSQVLTRRHPTCLSPSPGPACSALALFSDGPFLHGDKMNPAAAGLHSIGQATSHEKRVPPLSRVRAQSLRLTVIGLAWVKCSTPIQSLGPEKEWYTISTLGIAGLRLGSFLPEPAGQS